MLSEYINPYECVLPFAYGVRLIVMKLSRVSEKPSGYQMLCTYRCGLDLRSSPRMFTIYGRQNIEIERAFSSRAGCKCFGRKKKWLYLACGSSIGNRWPGWFPDGLRRGILNLLPQKRRWRPWDAFYKQVGRYGLRPESLGLVCGYAGLYGESRRDPRASHRMFVGLEEWLLRVPLVRTETVDHELIHAAQEARFKMISTAARITNHWKRSFYTLMVELQAWVFGSTLMTLALVVLIIKAFYPVIAQIIRLKFNS